MSSPKHILQKLFNTELSLTAFAAILSGMTFLFFHIPFFKYVFNNIDYTSLNGVFVIVCLVALLIVANGWFFYMLLSASRLVGKILISFFFIANSIALYFINTFSVIMDKSMMGNLINTTYSEASSFFSVALLVYVLLLGILPTIYIFKAKTRREPGKRFLRNFFIGLGFIVVVAFANASNWLWVDKHSTQLGALVFPWCYTVNISRYYIHEHKRNRKEIPLPDATITNTDKAVVVLVIGESARSQNFSLYGYNRNTNPILSQTERITHYYAEACATYTTAAVKCLLEHEHTNELYEILPNYLFRNGVEVIWRTSNWGEPPVHIDTYQRVDDLTKLYPNHSAQYDEILMAELKDVILQSPKDKTLIVLHTYTSHGPNYNKKYPPQFEHFSPVCNSVELSNCSQQELINAYDNTIVYTDYLLSEIINTLKELPDHKSSLIFVSDHGESLGEKNLYMHGVPMSFAPREQVEVPFIVWTSEGSKETKPLESVPQTAVFHSVMNFLSVTSDIYNEELNIFE